MKEFDVILVGGGLVGLTVAALLAQESSLNILILEAQQSFPTWKKDKLSNRVSAISSASKNILSNLSVWQAIVDRRVSPFLGMQVWDSKEKSEITFQAKDLPAESLGYIIENEAIHAALLDKIKQCPFVECKLGVSLLDIKTYDRFIEVKTADANAYRAKLVIAADGVNSWVRQHLSIESKTKNYQQEAYVANVKTALSHKKIARQIFLDGGVLAFLPLADLHWSSIVWSLDEDEVKRINFADDAAFCARLGEVFPYLGEIKATGPRQKFVLKSHCVKEYTRPRLALVGDAAHSVHPLAGLGVNMGFLDAASLAEVLLAALSSDEDIGQHAYLRRYERRRKADNLPLLIGIDLIQRLYHTDSKFIQTLRDLGLNSVNKLTFLKKFFCRYAAGQ